MNSEKKTMIEFSDREIIAEAGRRLASKHRKETGQKFMYGHFKLLFHDGRLAKVEEWSRCNRFSEVSANNLTECTRQ